MSILSQRIAQALGVQEIKDPDRVVVDDVDRRYRDAIKAGAKPLEPPSEGVNGRVAILENPQSGVQIRLVSDVHPTSK